jgi:hypothetical protein
LADEERQGMHAISRRTSVPVSALIRKAIEEFVCREKEKLMRQHEGSLRITPYESIAPKAPQEYDVTYAPYDRTGGALRARRLLGRDALVSFLKSEAHLNEDALKGALAAVDTQKSASVPHVIFTEDEIARLGLTGA